MLQEDELIGDAEHKTACGIKWILIAAVLQKKDNGSPIPRKTIPE